MENEAPRTEHPEEPKNEKVFSPEEDPQNLGPTDESPKENDNTETQEL